jgi:small redox-active disulfide protein 2
MFGWEEKAMRIEIFGVGCPKCATLTEDVEKAVLELGIAAEIVEVKDIKEIVRRGVMFAPALAIDGVVKSSGRLLDVEKIKALLIHRG